MPFRSLYHTHLCLRFDHLSSFFVPKIYDSFSSLGFNKELFGFFLMFYHVHFSHQTLRMFSSAPHLSFRCSIALKKKNEDCEKKTTLLFSWMFTATVLYLKRLSISVYLFLHLYLEVALLKSFFQNFSHKVFQNSSFTSKALQQQKARSSTYSITVSANSLSSDIKGKKKSLRSS